MNDRLREIAKELGRRGGEKTRDLHGKKHFALIGAKSAAKRKKKKK